MTIPEYKQPVTPPRINPVNDKPPMLERVKKERPVRNITPVNLLDRMRRNTN
jgi:hypothetical protein